MRQQLQKKKKKKKKKRDYLVRRDHLSVRLEQTDCHWVHSPHPLKFNVWGFITTYRCIHKTVIIGQKHKQII